MKVMTRDLLEQMKTDNGGFTGATVEALGLKWKDLRKGWTFKIIGNEYTEDAIAAAIDGRNKGKTFKVKKDAPAVVVGNVTPVGPLTPRQIAFAVNYCGLDEADVKATPPVVIRKLIDTTTRLWELRKQKKYPAAPKYAPALPEIEDYDSPF